LGQTVREFDFRAITWETPELLMDRFKKKVVRRISNMDSIFSQKSGYEMIYMAQKGFRKRIT